MAVMSIREGSAAAPARLKSALGLALLCAAAACQPTTVAEAETKGDAYWLDAAYYTQRQLNADLAVAQPTLCAAYNSAPFPQTWNNHTNAAVTLDNTSAYDWIASNIAGGTSGKLGRILLTSLLSEYGCEPATQSALKMLDRPA